MAMRVKRFLQSYAHLLVALLLTAVLTKILASRASLLRIELQRQPQTHFRSEDEKVGPGEKRPHAQDIAESINTFWTSFHQHFLDLVPSRTLLECLRGLVGCLPSPSVRSSSRRQDALAWGQLKARLSIWLFLHRYAMESVHFSELLDRLQARSRHARLRASGWLQLPLTLSAQYSARGRGASSRHTANESSPRQERCDRRDIIW